ncbi:MAG TPA: hypothetical protein DD473_01765 [Planctomycetaceae bacterium]|nr:hypothetical protein [Planctomycetaceae bacterium]
MTFALNGKLDLSFLYDQTSLTEPFDVLTDWNSSNQSLIFLRMVNQMLGLSTGNLMSLETALKR